MTTLNLASEYWQGMLLMGTAPIVLPSLLANTMVKLSQPYKIYDLSPRNNQWLEEFASLPRYLAGHGLGIYLPLVSGIGHLATNASLLEHFWSFLVVFCWNEIQYFFTHYAYHKVKWLWWIHKTHHRVVISTGYSAWLSSFAETFIFAMLLTSGYLLLSNAIFLSWQGFVVNYLFYFFMNVNSHNNVETVSPNFRKRLGWFASNTITTHALHHARSDANFGLLLPLLDQLFRTRSSDREQVYQAVIRGRSLKTLSQRLRSTD